MTEERWKGLFKLAEECGEVLQVIGKLGPFPNGKHPDGGLDLGQRLANELADLHAAIIYVTETNSLSVDPERIRDKLDKFRKWGLTGVKL